jgi:hypothetical protein
VEVGKNGGSLTPKAHHIENTEFPKATWKIFKSFTIISETGLFHSHSLKTQIMNIKN